MAIIILCFWSPSPKHRHDLHCHPLDTLISIIASWLSRQLLLLQLSLTHSDKVKQLHGVCISYNKVTTIRLLAVSDNFYKTWSSHTITYITSCLDHITSHHALQKQVRRPLLCCCKFCVAATGFYQERSYLRIKTTTIFRQVCCFNLQQGPGVATLGSTKVGETDNPPATCVQSTSVEPVSRKRTRNVSLGCFIQ